MNFHVIAVDFDGTLCKDAYPNIGEPNKPLIRYLLDEQKRGSKLILWTCRCGKYLDEAVSWCLKHGLKFDAVNDNIPEATEFFGSNSQKVFAHVYIDDKNSYMRW